MSSTDPARPNILFILSDDQGPWALGCAGNREIHTPNLDALAASGTRMENFFCASPVCSPARASLMTGQVPSRHGVHDYLDGSHVGPGAVDYLAGQTMFTDALADNGYRLGLSGKWHLGANDLARKGFSHWFALDGGGSPYGDYTMHRNGRAEPGTRYLTDAITDDAMEFLAADLGGSAPFFLAVNYTAPHKPWKGEHPEEFEALYADCTFESCPQEPTHPWQPMVHGAPIGGEADTRAALVGYFAAVSAMDAAIGRILGQLRKLGQDENTIVVFSSDNGFNCGHHGIWGKGNGTFPQNMYDSSVKVPCVFRWHGRITSDSVRRELVSAYDVASTILQLAGLDYLDFEKGPGRSFAPLLSPDIGDAAARARNAVVVFDEYGPVRMIRKERWKYVHRYPHGPHELYDLHADPDERVNRVGDDGCRNTLQSLRSELDDWFAEQGVGPWDGARLPVVGAGQLRPLGTDPLGAFAPAPWADAATS